MISQETRRAERPATRTGIGVLLTVLGASSTQVGAAVGSFAFPAIGPIGVVAVRQLFMAVVLVIFSRLRLRMITRKQWPAIVGLGVVLAVINIAVYSAIDRIGLGLTVTLEFLGPLAVAIATSRRIIDLAGALLAVTGVVVLVQPGPTTDVFGVALALIGAIAWASYILLNRRVGAQLPGMQGLAAASVVSAVIWMPITVWWFVMHPPPLWAIGLALVCGVLSSLIPYPADILALRRISSGLYSTLMSLHPVVAALAGVLMLGELLTLQEWSGIFLVVVSNAVVTTANVRRSRR